ncbi:MAG: pyrroline-5-carboxylate reductase [Sulfolobales archaeon]
MGISEEIKVIAVIGAGKIGSAIIKGIKECYSDIHIIATGRRDTTLENAKSLGAEVTRNNKEAIAKAGLVILSVKPHHFPVIIKEVGRDVWSGKIVISVMAGVKLNTLSSVLLGAKIFRAMTNINASVKKASTAISTLNGNDHEKRVVEELFKCLGTVYWVPEEYIDIWTALAGSGPAFISEIVDALVLGAVASGMPRDIAYKAILDVLEGTAILLKNKNVHPAEIRDEVTTPGGTTIKGLAVMESRGIKSALIETIEAAYKRSFEIGNDIDLYIRKELNMYPHK